MWDSSVWHKENNLFTTTAHPRKMVALQTTVLQLLWYKYWHSNCCSPYWSFRINDISKTCWPGTKSWRQAEDQPSHSSDLMMQKKPGLISSCLQSLKNCGTQCLCSSHQPSGTGLPGLPGGWKASGLRGCPSAKHGLGAILQSLPLYATYKTYRSAQNSTPATTPETLGNSASNYTSSKRIICSINHRIFGLDQL